MNGKPAGLSSPSTLVSEPKEIESLRTTFTASSTTFIRGLPKFDQAGFALVKFQAELCKADMKFLQACFRVVQAFETNHESSSPGELHPQALTEPDVNLSAHPALIVQSQDEFRVTTSQTGLVLAEQHGPASELPYVDGYAEV